MTTNKFLIVSYTLSHTRNFLHKGLHKERISIHSLTSHKKITDHVIPLLHNLRKVLLYMSGKHLYVRFFAHKKLYVRIRKVIKEKNTFDLPFKKEEVV